MTPDLMSVPEAKRQLFALLDRDQATDARELLERLPDGVAKACLEAVGRSPDPETRFFAAPAARQRLGAAAVDLIADIAKHDRHEDVRYEAMWELVKIAPGRAREFWAPLRKRLKSGALYDAELAGWGLLRLHDPMLGDLMERASGRFPPHYYIHKSFAILRLCIDGRVPELISRVTGHDHDHMTWLGQAATFVQDVQLWDAVESLATNAPDEECRRICASALRFRRSADRL